MIRGPKGAIPTNRGWVHPRTGELLKSQRITDEQIVEWHGVSTPEPVVQTLHEAPVMETVVSPEVEEFYYAEEEDLEDEEE